MLTLFRICFWTGTLLAVVSFVLGRILDLLNMEGVDFQGEVPLFAISPFKPIVILTFITIFGGVGMMSMEKWGSGISFGIAFLTGSVISFLIYGFVVVPLYKAQNTSSVYKQELIGHNAKVALGMKGKGFGKVTYYVKGNTYNAPAKSLNGKKINTGDEVTIVKIENHVFYVVKIEKNKLNHVLPNQGKNELIL